MEKIYLQNGPWVLSLVLATVFQLTFLVIRGGSCGIAIFNLLYWRPFIVLLLAFKTIELG